MKIGTKSILFGVHQFIWHPVTVARAFKWLYGRWPDRYEWCGIIFHDLGYWGKPNIDGKEGRLHPYKGAEMAGKAAIWVALQSGHGPRFAAQLGAHIQEWTLRHSRELSKQRNVEPSSLCWADKACCFFDPTPLYLLRSCASGEMYEFRVNARGHVPDDFSYRDWYNWYRLMMWHLPQITGALRLRHMLEKRGR